MSISINSTYGNYATNYSSAISQKTQSEQEAKAASTNKVQEKTTSKTYTNTAEYKAMLSEKYSCLKPSKDCSVTIAPGLLSKAATDEKTAQWLEHNLNLMPDAINSVHETAAQRGARVISYSATFESYDCITAQVCTVVEADPGTDEAKKLLEEVMAKNKERKEQQEELLEKSKAKNEAAEKRAEKSDKTFTLQFNGKDTDDLMRNMWRSLQSNSDISVSNMNSDFITNLFNMTV